MDNQPDHHAITATYRLQFQRDFPFSGGQKLAGYLADLGISHVYCSPVLTARSGSLHGYDVVDYTRINPELGGETAFRAMASAFAEQGIGLILDIVPNHVAVGHDDNAMWLDLLKHGARSRYAEWFDVDFQSPDPFLAGKVHAPFLGEPVSQALNAGKLEVVVDALRDGFALRYGEHLFPLRVEDSAEIIAMGPQAYRDGPAMMRELIDRQNFRLDYWRNASDRLNWRRFFEVTQLAGIRIENPDAFEAAHQVAFQLYSDGLIQGLRVDHVDGLADPAAYCSQLRARLRELAPDRPQPWLLVEKILAPGEPLAAAWNVDGTTGYDFMDQVSALQHDPAGAEPLARLWALISGRSPAYSDEEHAARREVLDKGFVGQRELLVTRLLSFAELEGRDEDLPRGAIRRAVVALVSNLRSYRTYATGAVASEALGSFFDEALRVALDEPLADEIAMHFVADVLAGAVGGERPQRAEIIRRFNQLSSPLAARAVEDTTFYRYGRLLSRNDVGFDAVELAMPVDRFHGLMQERATHMPRSMLALATHDHKRGADVRARLAVISEVPDAWRQATNTWRDLNRSVRPDGLDAGDEYFLYQILVGSWPMESGTPDQEYVDRLVAWWIKSLREAKLRTDWTAPNAAYENQAESFVRAILDPSRSAAFVGELQSFIDRIAPAGALNGLVQLVVQCTVPGVPDTYQGTECWDLTGVDPDNRRPVDYALRQQAGSSSWQEELQSWRDGLLKQRILRVLLRLRREMPDLFGHGDYQRLQVSGRQHAHILAFARSYQGRSLAVVAPLRTAAAIEGDLLALSESWLSDTAVDLTSLPGAWTTVLGAQSAGGVLQLRETFQPLPLWVGLTE